jgi:predicted nucleic acid-binding protein
LTDGPPEVERRKRGLLDTSAVIDLDRLVADDLPLELAVSAITMAELAAGPHATSDPQERAGRIERLQAAEATFDHLPLDAFAARAYGRIYAAVLASGRKARGRRALDLLIAATALANELPLYTCNPDDFEGLTELVEVVAVKPALIGAEASSQRSASDPGVLASHGAESDESTASDAQAPDS